MLNNRSYAELRSGGTKLQLVACIIALFLTCLIAPQTGAGQGQAGANVPPREDQDRNRASARAVEVDIKGVRVTIPDVDLRDQEGRKIRFYSDLIKGRVVVLSFFYTSCMYICTMQGRVLSELQSLLGDRLGKSVFLISVTIDPVKDNPEQLKSWGTRYNVRPGWTLVTGEETEMNKLLIPFTGSTAGGGMHLGATFIGNDRKRFWTSASGVFAPQELLSVVDYVAGDRPDRLK